MSDVASRLRALLPKYAVAACEEGTLRKGNSVDDFLLTFGAAVVKLIGSGRSVGGIDFETAQSAEQALVEGLQTYFPALVGLIPPQEDADKESIARAAAFWLQYEKLAFAWEGRPGLPPWRPFDLTPAMLNAVLTSAAKKAMGIGEITGAEASSIGGKGYIGDIQKLMLHDNKGVTHSIIAKLVSPGMNPIKNLFVLSAILILFF